MHPFPSILRPFFTTKNAIRIALAFVALLLTIRSVTPKQAHFLTDENGIVENATMALYATATLICLYYAFRTKGALRYYLFLWATLSFVFFGEEISLGQFCLKYAPPKLLSSAVKPDPPNHTPPKPAPKTAKQPPRKIAKKPNGLFSSQNTFYLGFATYFLLLPLLSYCRPTASILNRLRFPAPNPPLLLAIWIPVAFSFLLTAFTPTRAIRDALVETRELYFAVSILLYTIFLVTLTIPKNSSSNKTP